MMTMIATKDEILACIGEFHGHTKDSLIIYQKASQHWHILRCANDSAYKNVCELDDTSCVMFIERHHDGLLMLLNSQSIILGSTVRKAVNQARKLVSSIISDSQDC